MINFSELLWKAQDLPTRAVKPGGAVRRAEPVRQDPSIASAPFLATSIGEDARIIPREANTIARDRFRFLRMKLREVRELANLQSLLITSPLAQDGKSTVVLNVASTLTEGGKRSVLVIEADLHRPTLTKRLGVDPGHESVATGLGQCLRDNIDPLTCVRRVKELYCHLLPAGKPVSDPTELVQSERWGEIMARLGPHFDWILVDSPPLLPLTDAISLSRACDASLLVVRAHQTPKEAVKEALGLLGRKNVLGVLFNASEAVNQTYAKYGSYYAET